MTSGARYERDCTYELSWSVVKHEEPKSMTLTSHLQREAVRDRLGLILAWKSSHLFGLIA